MDDGALSFAADTPLEKLCPASNELFRTNSFGPVFERLRREAPVHWSVADDPAIGGFWSVTRYHDILAVDADYDTFSSARGIALPDMPNDFPLPMFIAMDPPTHDAHRKVVQPIVAPANLAFLGPIIRERAGKILDSLPIGEEFDWVEAVSVELTTMTLATLFDFPWEERDKLTRWSRIITNSAEAFDNAPDAQKRRQTELIACLEYFIGLWHDRAQKPPGNDLISMLVHGEATKNMSREEFLGILCLLIVGGTDTTRNTISGSVVAMDQNPGELKKVQENRDLIPSMVSESIRWQTPVTYIRRTVTRDTEVAGQKMAKGDKLAIWYISGNRDGDAIVSPERYWIDRPQVRRHMSFGFGIHRCVGNRLAELQLKIVWEEMLRRFPKIEVVDDPVVSNNMLLRGFDKVQVRIPARL
jgi:cytochrome P450